MKNQALHLKQPPNNEEIPKLPTTLNYSDNQGEYATNTSIYSKDMEKEVQKKGTRELGNPCVGQKVGRLRLRQVP